jgi:hypothetical protein
MKGSELYDFFTRNELVKAFFLGVLPAESAKKIKSAKSKTFAIINTDRSSEQGHHWYCAIRGEGTHLDVFDSLGSTSEEITRRLGQLRDYSFNSSAVQGTDSPNCGLFAAYFAFCKITNYSDDFETVLNDYFTADKERNDLIVLNWWNDGVLFDPFQDNPHPKKRDSLGIDCPKKRDSLGIDC